MLAWFARQLDSAVTTISMPLPNASQRPSFFTRLVESNRFSHRPASPRMPHVW